MSYPYSSPIEAVRFVDLQFDRFKAPKPSEQSLDKIIQYVSEYVIVNSHYPQTPQDAFARYEYPGLTDGEKHDIVDQLEFELKAAFDQKITFHQINLAAWATIMFCWSEQGEEHLNWYKRLAEESKYEYEKVLLPINA